MHGDCSRAILLALLTSLGAPPGAWAGSRNYDGICEASAAVLIDKSHVAIASDDFQSILTYERGKAKSITAFDVGDVTDIEAAARIGNTVFWLSSHSLNSSGEDKKKRKVLFTTDVTADGTLTNVGKVYRNLRADLAAALGRSEERLKPSLNIEGMADTPDGHLLIGLRGPETLPGDRAILIEIGNPKQLVGLETGGATKAKIERVVTLDLSDGPGTVGRGVRDIVRVGQRYLIIGGSEPDGGNPAPKLFWWDGQSETTTPGPSADLTGMTPEAVVAWDDQAGEVFSDNGGSPIEGTECSDKSPPAKAFFPAVDVKF
ncbi:DUF3616 domain-containing protein [Rhizobium sp. BK251]|uniref:DUF3616 domain-containing protein n=1 Tax=Rhizobium sp. BK251 TaxID=2512125 RepID=UPI0010EBA9D8|nr:DUF3616 domain-containing protein [Rhizobium sp. BK251]TCL68452.1 hypothetical protein EV286_109382 [Rhizobium sp. BK251]